MAAWGYKFYLLVLKVSLVSESNILNILTNILIHVISSL